MANQPSLNMGGWDATGARFNPIPWLNLIWVEKVLYHEMGRHVPRHSFGQSEEEEDQADAYALRKFLSSRPALYKVLKIIAKVVKLFKRKPA
jgi:hypothetical protein